MLRKPPGNYDNYYHFLSDVQQAFRHAVCHCFPQNRVQSYFCKPSAYKRKNVVYLDIGGPFRSRCLPFESLLAQIPTIFPFLEQISIHYNFLETLPASFSTLVNLTSLLIKSQRFSEFSNDFFANVIHLGSLALYHTKISQMPPSFFKLPSFRIFYLENTPLCPWDLYTFRKKCVSQFAFDGRPAFLKFLIENDRNPEILLDRLLENPTNFSFLTNSEMIFLAKNMSHDHRLQCDLSLPKDHPIHLLLSIHTDIPLADSEFFLI